MLGVFLLLAFTCLGHERQDLLSPCDGMHVCTDDLGLCSHLKEFWGVESEPMLTPREKSPLSEAQRKVEPAMLGYAGQQTQHFTD